MTGCCMFSLGPPELPPQPTNENSTTANAANARNGFQLLAALPIMTVPPSKNDDRENLDRRYFYPVRFRPDQQSTYIGLAQDEL